LKNTVWGAIVAAIVFAPSAFAQAQSDDAEIPASPAAPQGSAPSPLVPSASTAPATAPSAVAAATAPDATRDAEIAELRARLDAVEAKQRTSFVRTLQDSFVLIGYVQGQYEGHQDSVDQLDTNGNPLNKDRFVVRRARLRLEGDWKYASTILEFQGNTSSGPNAGIQKAEAALQYYVKREDPNAAFAKIALGLFDVPFGYELTESPRFRPFMERTTGSRSIFPGEPDVGMRINGGIGFFRWTAAVINGEPLGEQSGFQLQDPNAAKDAVFRFGVDAKPRPKIHVTGGISAMRGKGFHAGTAATKATIQWHDTNEDGIIQTSELTAIPGNAATPSANFDRWLVGADAQAEVESSLGTTKVYAEVYVGSNYDRGLLPSDPILSGIDSRQFGWYVAGLQQVGTYGLVGLRFDYYDPNSDIFDSRGGKLLPYSQIVKTWSPLVGTVVPHGKLYVQYDIIDNDFGRSSLGVPTKLNDNTVTVRLQVEL
jgi:hypothetical protein